MYISQKLKQCYVIKTMLCNTLIQSYFDFKCCACYPNLSLSLKNKLQAT